MHPERTQVGSFGPTGITGFAPAAPQREVAGVKHPSCPAPLSPPARPALRRWAEQFDLAAEAWAPELSALIDGLAIGNGDRVLDAGCGPGIIIAGWPSGLLRTRQRRPP